MASPSKKSRGAFSPRSITMPIAAFVMAGILYTYSVTSIRAAKRNAQLHREADGGQLDMRRESLRRHGVLEAVEGTKGVQLFRDAGAEVKPESRQPNQNPNEEQTTSRTSVESSLQDYKGVGAAVKKFKQATGD